MTNVDVLVFGPHPHDIEIGVGGGVATHVDLGYRVGLCDLTRGELGSNGTVDQRMDEAQAAAEVLRRSRPAVALLPYWRDRHPDHESASRILTEAVFRAGLHQFAVDGDPWRPDWTCYYFINDVTDASFVIDVTGAYDRKRQALACHRSQFRPAGDQVLETRLTASIFHQMIESRDAHLGALIGAGQAEGVVVKGPLIRSTWLKP